MSRMTAAQVIALGEYLNPDFEASSLTVPQLLGVFGFHNVKYPSAYTKPKLVQLFNEEIKAKSTKFKKERIKKANSIASDEGITDGITGEPIGGSKVTRRSSRRLSRAPSQDEERDLSPERPEPPKRRRSSAQPSLGGPSSRRVAPVQPALIEESEPEDEIPIRKVGRSKKSSADAASQARRVAQSNAEDSGWEDNNVFQSGAESSSPLRPSPAKVKARRSSVARTTRNTQKSTSAPPQLPPSPQKPIPLPRGTTPQSPPQSKFEPQLPPSVVLESRTIDAHPRTSFSPRGMQRGVVAVPSMVQEEEIEEVFPDDVVEGEDQALDDLEAEVEEDETTALAQIDDNSSSVIRRPRAKEGHSTSFVVRILLALLTFVVSSGVMTYKSDSAQIGYCEPGRNTNEVLEAFKARWAAIEVCNKENLTHVDLPSIPTQSTVPGRREVDGMELVKTECPPLPLIPVPHPTSCTPCPEHATCTTHDVACETGYLLRPHLLFSFVPLPNTPSSSSASDLAWQVISSVADGFPGLGSVAFPPRCVEDPRRKRNIGALGKAVESMLGQERGKRYCKGDVSKFTDDGGGEARTWGVEIEILKDGMRRKTAPQLLDSFDGMFDEAISQLVQWGGVIVSMDQEGRRYLAHKTPDLTWDCVVTVRAREAWQEWRMTVLGAVALVFSAFLARIRRGRRQIEDRRVAELVQIALDTLRNQELAYHTDPVTATHPYLSSVQLRDLILQEEHSIPTRTKLWDRVEHVVESNANVRANLEEVSGGEEMRVWRWVGSTTSSPRKLPSGSSGPNEG
ncbi:hypothetical protein JAAARDRAFT_31860 [Jaapia argillacea MUCL 33604]|uniref:Man1/Src1 C-terminal domain-containing protein n=1 Tax=Jaapia argillacea MUCL 33604 TaxID=933084 RepID=A0A067Q3Z3_9AGAM|nr:hypothetical protein JAAARDRAFT_31860 [Jaapia argillacea MUCL 33604]